jgi:hypothetical protein
MNENAETFWFRAGEGAFHRVNLKKTEGGITSRTFLGIAGLGHNFGANNAGLPSANALRQ